MSIKEYQDFKARTYEGAPGGQRVIGGEPESTNRIGAILIVVLVIILIIAGALALYFLVIRRRSSTDTGGGGDGGGGDGGGNGGGGTTGCTSNDACSGGKVCNLSTGLCVNCLTNSNCSGSTPICNTSTDACVECVTAGDCDSGTCESGICCDSSPPVITGVTTNLAASSSFTVNYTYSQSNLAGSQVEVRVETGTGVLLTTVTAPATGSNTFTEAQLNLPNQHLFPATSYRVALRINYTCNTAASTTFTTPFPFTMGSCTATGLVPNEGIANGSANAAFNFYPGACIRTFTIPNPYQAGVLIDQNSGFHPNLASVYHSLVTAQQVTITVDSSPFSYTFIGVPFPGPVGSTFYFRYYNIGTGSNCNSNLSGQLAFTRGEF